ncbi:hypothetical protein [Lentzea flava]|nr:hypothetical protein [Lentzea flava]
MARLRKDAMVRGAWPVRMREASSVWAVSRIQCSRFSMRQWLRVW